MQGGDTRGLSPVMEVYDEGEEMLFTRSLWPPLCLFRSTRDDSRGAAQASEPESQDTCARCLSFCVCWSLTCRALGGV